MSENLALNDRPDSGLAAEQDQALALALAVAIRTGAYYDTDNVVTREACSNLASLLSAQSDEGEVTVAVHSHCVFVGKARVRATASTYARFAYLIELFQSWNIQTLTFFESLTTEELTRAILSLARKQPTDPRDLADILRDQGIDGVCVDMALGEAKPQAIAHVQAYAAAMELSQEMLDEAGAATPPTIRRARRVTQMLVDQILHDPRSAVALTTIKDFDSFLICHAIDVAILAVMLGRRLGMGKSKLGELCLAAFLHDAGKLVLSRDILDKPTQLDPAEREMIRHHPILAACTLLDERRPTASCMRAVVVAFEHHLNSDLSGYPSTVFKDTVTVFGRIVSITDQYDALTSPRPYRTRNFTPHEALVYLLRNVGKLVDPVLTRLFAEIMGLYPPGTMVHLTSGELGVVCAAPDVGRPLDRPRVRVLAGNEQGRTIDLDERIDGQFVRGVKSVLNPGNKGQIPAVDPAIFDEPA